MIRFAFISRLLRADQFFPWLYFIMMLLIFGVFQVTPWPVADLNRVFPDLMLAVTFIWAVLRPELCGYITVFIIGLWADLLLGSPIGMHAVLNMCLLLAIKYLRPVIVVRGFGVIWACFAASATGYFIVKQILLLFTHDFYGMSFGKSIVQLLLTIIVFAPIFGLIMAGYRFIMARTVIH